MKARQNSCLFFAGRLATLGAGIIGALLGTAAISASQSNDTIFSVLSKFEESLQPTRPVSGDLIAGLAGVGRGSVLPLRIEAWVPGQWKDQSICIMLRSRDGRYEAYQSFAVPASWQSDHYVFDFSEARERDFLKREVRQLAPIVHLGECGSDVLDISLAYWGGQAEDAGTQSLVFVNAMRAEESSIYFFADETEIQCAVLDAADRQVFDFVCEADGRHGTHRIEVNRIRRGSYDDAVEFTLHFPASLP